MKDKNNKKRDSIVPQHLGIGFSHQPNPGSSIKLQSSFLPTVCLKIICMDLISFKEDFPAIYWEIKKEGREERKVGCLGCSNPGWDHHLGCCKSGRRFVVLSPALEQGSGMSAPDIQACLKTGSCLLPLLLAPRKEQAVLQPRVVQRALWCGATARRCLPLTRGAAVCSPLCPISFLQGMPYSTLSTKSVL